MSAAELELGITITRGHNASAIAAAVFLAYDSLLCLDHEIQHVWKARWSPVKVLYLVSRYYGIAHVIAYSYIGVQQDLTIPYCNRYLWWQIIGGNLVFAGIVNILLILRLIALYHKSLKVTFSLVALFLAEITIEMYSFINLTLDVSGRPIQLPSSLGIPITGCLFELPKEPTGINLSLMAWCACLTMSIIFFLMTIYPFFHSLRSTRNNKILAPSDFFRRPGKALAPLLVGFVRDGAIFFMVIFMIVLVNTLISELAPLYTTSALPWFPAIHSFASTRLVLSLKIRTSHGTTVMTENFTNPGTFHVAPRQEPSLSIPGTVTSIGFDISPPSRIDLEMVKLKDRS